MATRSGDGDLATYRRRNLTVVLVLLALWFAVSILGIWTVRALNQLTWLKFPFGFWLGAQGSLLTFIAEIFFYAKYMDRLDRERGRSGGGRGLHG